MTCAFAELTASADMQTPASSSPAAAARRSSRSDFEAGGDLEAGFNELRFDLFFFYLNKRHELAGRAAREGVALRGPTSMETEAGLASRAKSIEARPANLHACLV